MGTVGLLRNPIHVNLNEVKGLLTLVESSSRRFLAEFTLSAGRRLFASLRVTASEGLRMTRGGFFNSSTVTYYGAVSRRGMTRWSVGRKAMSD